MITVDELRAAGALEVPPEWRKSLCVERDLFSGLFGHDDLDPEEPPSVPTDQDDDESAA